METAATPTRDGAADRGVVAQAEALQHARQMGAMQAETVQAQANSTASCTIARSQATAARAERLRGGGRWRAASTSAVIGRQTHRWTAAQAKQAPRQPKACSSASVVGRPHGGAQAAQQRDAGHRPARAVAIERARMA